MNCKTNKSLLQTAMNNFMIISYINSFNIINTNGNNFVCLCKFKKKDIALGNTSEDVKIDFWNSFKIIKRMLLNFFLVIFLFIYDFFIVVESKVS